MTFKIIISSAIVSAFIAMIGSIITAKIAQKTAVKTAEETANREIEKMERTWQREDLVSSDEEFAEMASSVAAFVFYNDGTGRLQAMQHIAAIRSKEVGHIATILDNLYNDVRAKKIASANLLLNDAIEEKRKIRTGNPSKPSA